MEQTTLTTIADHSTANAIKSAQNSQNEMIKNVGIGIGVILVVLIIVIILAVRHSKRTPLNQTNDSELKDQVKELLEQNRKLTDEVEKLKKENNKKGGK